MLLVEDNPADAYLVHEFLEEQTEPAYALTHVETLAAAQHALTSDPPDIALVDLSLPDSQGLETFTTAQDWAPELPIVILTGLDDRRVALEAVRKGAQDYLPKGELNALVLTRVIGYALERSRKDKAIAARERRFRAMIEHTSDVIVLLDPAYRIRAIHLGDANRRHTGFAPEFLEGKDFVAYVHPDDQAAVRTVLDAAPEQRHDRTVVYRFLQASGAWAWREAVATNLLDDPAVGAVVVNTRDIDERKRAEAESQRHKRILEAAIEAFPGVFFLLNDDARLVTWNRNLEDITGRTAAQLTDADPLHLLHEHDEVADVLQRAFRDGAGETLAHLLASDGTQIPYFLTGRSFVLDEATYVVGMGLDVTERRDAQRQVAFQASLLAQVETAVIAAEQDGRVIYWNDYAARLYGYSESEALGRDITELTVPPDAMESAQRILAEVLDAGSWTGEFEVRRKDGSTVPTWTSLTRAARDDGALVFLGASTDISEAKRAEQERKALLGELGERVKELRMLHRASVLLRDEEASLQEVLEDLIGELPNAWRHPRDTAAQIVFRDLHDGVFEAATPSFRDTPWMQEGRFVTHGGGQGRIRVAYMRDARPSDADGDPFIPEEQALLASLSEMLRSHLDRREANRRNEVLTQDLSAQVSRLGALGKIDEAILKTSDLEPTLDVIVAQAQRVLQVDAVDVFLFAPETKDLRFGAGTGFCTHISRGTPLALGSGLAGQAALRQEPLGVPDLSASELPDVPKALVEDEGFVSYYAVPLISKGELQGVLGAHHRSPLAFAEEWRESAADIGRQAAIAIDHAHLFSDVQRSRDELQLSYDRTIEGWARALDLKDEETAGHSQRVTELTVELARTLGFSGEALDDVRRGALLHDIGKMGIPDAVLLKPGKLDAEEWETIKRHPVHARDFLAGVPFLERALDIPYAHHERWDGSGYPRGLRGEDIPLPARIFAVADVFDALTSDRPYRAAWSRAQAYGQIEREAGTHFDPRVVAAFLELLDEQAGTTG